MSTRIIKCLWSLICTNHSFHMLFALAIWPLCSRKTNWSVQLQFALVLQSLCSLCLHSNILFVSIDHSCFSPYWTFFLRKIMSASIVTTLYVLVSTTSWQHIERHIKSILTNSKSQAKTSKWETSFGSLHYSFILNTLANS